MHLSPQNQRLFCHTAHLPGSVSRNKGLWAAMWRGQLTGTPGRRRCVQTAAQQKGLWEGSSSRVTQQQPKLKLKGSSCIINRSTRMLFYITSSQASFLKSTRQSIDSNPTQNFWDHCVPSCTFPMCRRQIYFRYHSPFCHKNTSVFHGTTLLRYMPHQRGIFLGKWH